MRDHDVRREKVALWISEPLADDVKRAIERLASSSDVVRVAVMPVRTLRPLLSFKGV